MNLAPEKEVPSTIQVDNLHPQASSCIPYSQFLFHGL
jgi:hypothetical protein